MEFTKKESERFQNSQGKNLQRLRRTALVHRSWGKHMPRLDVSDMFLDVTSYGYGWFLKTTSCKWPFFHPWDWYIYLHENHNNQPNVGKLYQSHGWYGWCPFVVCKLNIANCCVWKTIFVYQPQSGGWAKYFFPPNPGFHAVTRICFCIFSIESQTKPSFAMGPGWLKFLPG